MKLSKPRINPLQKDELTIEQRKLLEPLGQAANLNAFKTFVRYPKLFQKLVSLVIYISQESDLPSRDKELLVLRISWLCRAEYEWSLHVISGKQTGLSDQDIIRITKGPKAKGWGSFEATLLQAVDELHKDKFISDSTWAALTNRYTEKQLADLILIVGTYDLASMILNSFGVQLEEGVTGFS